MDNKAELIIASNSKNIALARIAVATFASQLNFTLAEIEEIKVAISEAVSNAIIHGYQDQTGKIEIKMNLVDGKLKIEIIDQGRGIENISQATNVSYTDDGRMGLGLTFIDSFMNSFEIESKLDCGTKLKMSKKPQKNKAEA